MSSVIRQETAVFLFFVLHGAVLTFFYDILRALRRSIRHSLAVLSLEDFLFWMTAGFLTFYLAFRRSDGFIRGYAVIGMLLGFLLYHFTLSAFAVRNLSGLFRRMVGVFRFLFRRIGMQLRRILRMLAYPCRILSVLNQKKCKFCKKRIEITRKKDYNSKKSIHNREGKNLYHKG